MTHRYRPTFAEIRPAAITANVARLVEHCAPAAVCAVVKGDGYGHGAELAARAALAGGASWLAVALPEEALALREAGIDAPTLLLSEPVAEAWDDLLAAAVDVTVYRPSGIDAADAAARRLDVDASLHLKIDTGMHRVGCDPADAVELAQRIGAADRLRLAGVSTHFATADDPSSLFRAVQLDRYRDVLDALEAAGVAGHLRHAANSAAAISLPAARFDLVRCGIACYGVPPSWELAGRLDLEPAMRLVSAVSHVTRIAAGEPVSYGCRFVAEQETTILTVPIGYADGVPRALGLNGGYVLVRGERLPVIGTVTMDQLMVDAGDLAVRVGEEVVLIGRQGDDEISANEVASREGSIGYEIVTRLGPRVPRVEV